MQLLGAGGQAQAHPQRRPGRRGLPPGRRDGLAQARVGEEPGRQGRAVGPRVEPRLGERLRRQAHPALPVGVGGAAGRPEAQLGGVLAAAGGPQAQLQVGGAGHGPSVAQAGAPQHERHRGATRELRAERDRPAQAPGPTAAVWF